MNPLGWPLWLPVSWTCWLSAGKALLDPTRRQSACYPTGGCARELAGELGNFCILTFQHKCKSQGEGRKTVGLWIKPAFSSVLESFQWSNCLQNNSRQRTVCTWNTFISLHVKRPHADRNHYLGILCTLAALRLEVQKPTNPCDCLSSSPALPG